ncbi:cytochrome P450 [Aspergillus alliaceus]|uniref:Cytochrome P450 n=1 Tax=Petromyces alliaceus TaxID=209559 RepID=A0A5N7BU85_PETAA|nr:cytochrome P450 [Aspergillus alliaceus]
MIIIPLTIAWVVLAIWQLYRASKTRSRRRKLAQEWNCQQSSHFPGGAFGINVLRLLRGAHLEGQIAHLHREGHLQYGSTLDANFLGHNVISTTEPENIQAILASQFSSFGLSQRRHPQYQPLLGEGIFTSDGKAWEHSRKLLRPQFTKDQLPALEWFDCHSEHFMQSLPSDGYAFDAQEIFFRLALDTATDFLFGECANSLLSADSNQTGVVEKGVGEGQGFAEAFDHAQYVLFQRSLAFSFYWLINPKQFRKANSTVHRFIDYYVNKALQCDQSNGSPQTKEKGPDYERYYFLRALASQTKDRKVLRDQLVNVLLASRDDVASLLSSIFYLLARDQLAWKKLKEEISHATSLCKDKIGLEEIQRLPYLRGVVHEALRLFPPVSLNARVARHDTTIPVGGGPDGRAPVFVCKGQTILYSVWALHRRLDLWGEDAEDFRPERWVARKQTAGEFLPFNAGPRVCLGQKFAVIQVSHLVFRAVQQLDRLESADTGPDMGMRPPMRQTLTMCHKHGVQVRVYRVKH